MRIGSSDPPRGTVELASQAHDLADSPLDIENVRSLHTENTACVTKRRQKDIRAIGLDDFADLVKSLQKDVINLASSHVHVLDESFGGHDQIVEPLLRQQDVIHSVSGDDDFISSAQRDGARSSVAKDRREHGREVDRGTSGRLDHLNVPSVAARDQTVQRELQANGVHLALENLVDHDQQSRLRVLTALHISVHLDSQAVVHARLESTVCTRGFRVLSSCFRFQKENVCLRLVCNLIHVVEDVGPRGVLAFRKDNLAVDIDCGTLLRTCQFLLLSSRILSDRCTNVMGVSLSSL